MGSSRHAPSACRNEPPYPPWAPSVHEHPEHPPTPHNGLRRSRIRLLRAPGAVGWHRPHWTPLDKLTHHALTRTAIVLKHTSRILSIIHTFSIAIARACTHVVHARQP